MYEMLPPTRSLLPKNWVALRRAVVRLYLSLSPTIVPF
jgi:hypothetical protein